MAAVQFQAGLSHLASGWEGSPSPCQGWNCPIGKFSESPKSRASPVEASLHWPVSSSGASSAKESSTWCVTAEGESWLVNLPCQPRGHGVLICNSHPETPSVGRLLGSQRTEYSQAARASFSKAERVLQLPDRFCL